jgi:uncharacterized protein YqgQ
MELIKLTEAPATTLPSNLSIDVINRMNASDFRGAYEKVAGTESQQLFFDKYLKKKFAGKEAKIEKFKDKLIDLLIALKFEEHPLINFLLDYITNHNMEPTGFITLNNLYANGIIDDVDLISSDLTPLLKSNLLEKTGYANAEFIIEAYQDIGYGSLNIEEMKRIVKEKLDRDDAKEVLKYDGDGRLQDSGIQTLTDLIIFEKGQINQKIDDPEKIKKTLTMLQTKNPDQVKKDTSRVSLSMAQTLKPSDTQKFEDKLKEFRKEDIPLILRYFKNKNFID